MDTKESIQFKRSMKVKPVITPPPLQIMMPNLDEEQKAGGLLGFCGAVTCIAGLACLGAGALKGCLPLVCAGALSAASGGAITFNVFKCEED